MPSKILLMQYYQSNLTKNFTHTSPNVNTYEATVNRTEDKIDEQQELDVAGLKDAFTKRVFDESMEEVLPMVQKIVDEAKVLKP